MENVEPTGNMEEETKKHLVKQLSDNLDRDLINPPPTVEQFVKTVAAGMPRHVRRAAQREFKKRLKKKIKALKRQGKA